MLISVPPHEPERLVSLRALGILDTPPEERFDRITRLAARVLAAPFAGIALVDADRVWLKSRAGLPHVELRRDWSLSAAVVASGESLCVRDAAADPRFALGDLVAGEPGLRFYAGHPLHGPSPYALGALFVAGPRPRDLEPEERALLHDLAQLVERELAAAETDHLLSLLRASEERYSSALAALSEGIVVQDADGTVRACNPSAEHILGLSYEQVMGRSAFDPGWRAIHEDGSPFRDEDRPTLVALATGRPALGVVMGIHLPDDRLVWIRVNAQPLFQPGATRPYAVVTSFTDITQERQAREALRESEERYRRIVETTSEGVWIIDPEGRTTFANRQMAAMLGCELDELRRRPLLAFVDPDWRDRFPDLPGQWRAQPPRQHELQLRRADGSRVWVLIETNQLLGQDGAYLGSLAMVRDISLRKAAETALQAQRDLFENLVAVARASSEGLTVEATLRNMLAIAMHLTRAACGGLFLVDAGGNATHAIWEGLPETASSRRNLPVVLDTGLAGWVTRHRQAALVSDITADARWLKLPEDPFPGGSALAVPILSGPLLLGILTLLHPAPGHFAPDDLYLMQAAADQLALAVRNAVMFDAQRRTAEREATLYETLRTVGGKLHPRAVARAAVDAVARVPGWAHVAIALPVDEQTGLLTVYAGGALPALSPAIPVSQGVIGRAFRSGRVQLVRDVGVDRDYVEASPLIHSELAVPLRRGERVLGVLDVSREPVDAFDRDDVLLAESLADAVALALDNARLYQASSEERGQLQALIRSTRDGVLLIDGDGRVRVVNAPALAQLALSGAPDDWLKRPLSELLGALAAQAPAAEAALRAEQRRYQAGDPAPGEGEYTEAGRAVHWVSLPVSLGESALGRLFMLRDVTQERQLDRLRDDLTHTMVHDLRSPLSSIETALDLLAMDAALPAEQVEVLDVAQHAVRRMLELVNGILDVSRLESGRMPVEYEAVDLARLIDEIRMLEGPRLQEKRLQCTAHLAPDLPPAWADPRLIRRVLQNLAGNAVKFTPEDGTIDITVERAGAGWLQVSVLDDGPGVAPELRPQLFQKFTTGTQRGRGSGLGLAFCRLAVEAHGGRIWFEAPPAGGGGFAFTLPARE